MKTKKRIFIQYAFQTKGSSEVVELLQLTKNTPRFINLKHYLFENQPTFALSVGGVYLQFEIFFLKSAAFINLKDCPFQNHHPKRKKTFALSVGGVYFSQ